VSQNPQLPVEPGLCDDCRHASVKATRRGTSYLRCTRASWDPRLAKYPRLPVTACVGYTPSDDHGGTANQVPRWSQDAGQADWIAPRLTGWHENTITKVIPAGFEAYARVLHPVESAEAGDRPVRWADVARWSGLELRPDARFHSVALPPADPGSPPPFGDGTPGCGTLYLPDALTVAAHCRAWTSAPDDCWFCVWDGFGWDNATRLFAASEDGEPPAFGAWRPPDPVPADVRQGQRVHLPNRDYLLYRGGAEAVADLAGLDGPNLWWPADQAWCVATELDLPWTYVGGPLGLIEALLADERIEALRAAPGDLVYHVEPWVTEWATALTEQVLTRGEATLTTPRGSIRSWLSGDGWLHTEKSDPDGTGCGSGKTILTGGAGLRAEVGDYLTDAVLGLVER
jgi:hypothetical protein